MTDDTCRQWQRRVAQIRMLAQKREKLAVVPVMFLSPRNGDSSRLLPVSI